MTLLDGVGGRVRRFARVLCVLAAAIVLAAPILLGPATSWAVQALGGKPEHHCACGMKPGKCGCPECERLEQDRRQAQTPHFERVLRGCDDDTPIPMAAALPTVMLVSVGLPPEPPPEAVVSQRLPDLLIDRGRDKPPTPPPRCAA